MSSLKIEGMQFKAYHGCLPEEALSGTDYEVQVYAQFDILKAATTDELQNTLDYCMVYDIVKVEMKINSKLIEHVAGRIYKRIMEEANTTNYIKHLEIHISKLNPPVNGYIQKSTVLFDGK